MNLLPPRHLYGRRQANENENSWSRYINEETNAKINSSYNYLEVEILSEKKHRKEWQDSLQTVPKKPKASRSLCIKFVSSSLFSLQTFDLDYSSALETWFHLRATILS